MFESISFRRQDLYNTNRPLDIGMLLECMLFYKKTTIIANEAILKQLLKQFSIEQLKELLEDQQLKLVYVESFTAIKTDKSPSGSELHQPVICTSPQHKFADIIRRNCVELIGKSGKGRRMAQSIEKNVTVLQHDNIIIKGGQESLLDQDYLKKASKAIIRNLVPEFRGIADAEFSTENTGKGIRFSTDIDLEELNRLYHMHVLASHSSITPAYILSHMLDVEFDLYLSSTYLTEIVANPLSSQVMAEKLRYVSDAVWASRKNIEKFQEIIFGDARALREAINNGEISIRDALREIRKANKFKEWLTKQDPTADLIKEYYKESTKESFIDKLPAKSVRWAIFTGLGFAIDTIIPGDAGKVVGTTLSALDAFYIDKLIKGWNPTCFIEENMKSLLKDDTKKITGSGT